MTSEQDKLNTVQFIRKVTQGSEGDNIYEDEKEQKFDAIPLIKPTLP